MTSMDNWERGMEALDRTQQSLERFLEALRNHYEQARPSSILPGSLDTHITGELWERIAISQVDQGRLPSNALLAGLLLRQIEFNKTVIQMLTDLDYRKSEPVP